VTARALPLALAVCAIAWMQAVPRPGSGQAQTLFRDIARDSGITFQHHAAPEKKFIVESMSGGVAMFDYDNDGRPDLYFDVSLTVQTISRPISARCAPSRNPRN